MASNISCFCIGSSVGTRDGVGWLWGGGGGGGGGGALGPPVVDSTDRSGAVVPVLVLLFVALWFVLQGDLFCVLSCVVSFLCFSVLLHCDYLAWGTESYLYVCSICTCLVLSVSALW